jgi:hypothetical protein
MGKKTIRWNLTLFGLFGAVLPSIVAVANRTDGFAFNPEPRVLVAQALYLASAAVLSGIFPYGKEATPFKATLVGIGFPTIIGTAFGATKIALPQLAGSAIRGGEGHAVSIVGWLVDTFALF